MKLLDHREVNLKGPQIYFTNLDFAASGLVYWTNYGFLLKKRIEKYIFDLNINNNFYFVETPPLATKELFLKTGHYQKYFENFFSSIKTKNEELLLRPMSCPFHCQLFSKLVSSYRQLPLRICEDAVLYRNEYSGGLRGIERVREMKLTDAHIFLDQDQINSELLFLYQSIMTVLLKFNLHIDYIELAVRDKNNPKNYIGSDEMWDKTESLLENFLISNNIKYKKLPGEAAFYGPKIDFQWKTKLNKNITISTIQLDFVLPKKFNLSYKDSNGNQKTPILIHRGLIGTYERFICALMEETQGDYPFWYTPTQIAIVPLEKANLTTCQKITNNLRSNGFYVGLFTPIVKEEEIGKMNLSKRINYWRKLNYKAIIVIGESEEKNNEISFVFNKKRTTISINDIVNFFSKHSK